MFIKLCKEQSYIYFSFKTYFTSTKTCKSTPVEMVATRSYCAGLFCYLRIIMSKISMKCFFLLFATTDPECLFTLGQNTLAFHITPHFLQCSNFLNFYNLNCKLNFYVSARLIFQKHFLKRGLLNVSYVLSTMQAIFRHYLINSHTYEVHIIKILVLQMRKRSLGRVHHFLKVATAITWQNYILDTGHFNFKTQATYHYMLFCVKNTQLGLLLAYQTRKSLQNLTLRNNFGDPLVSYVSLLYSLMALRLVQTLTVTR